MGFILDQEEALLLYMDGAYGLAGAFLDFCNLHLAVI